MKSGNEHLHGRTVVIIENEEDPDVSILISRVLLNYWALVCTGTEPGDFLAAKNHLSVEQFVAIAECGTDMRETFPQGITPGAVLWFYLDKKEEKNTETSNIPQSTIDLYDTSSYDVATRVNELMELTAFHVPEWLASSQLTITPCAVENVTANWGAKLGRLQKIIVKREIEDWLTYEISCELFLNKKGELFQRWKFQLEPITGLESRIHVRYWTQSHGNWNDTYPTKIFLHQMEQSKEIQPIIR